ADDSIVFGCYDGTLTRLDADSGEIIWRWRLDSSIHATPELDLAKQRLFINTEQWNNGNPFGHLQALDWKTGKLLWRYVHPWWPPGTPVYSSHANIVIATCNDQSVIAVNADNGSLIWRNSSKGLVRGKPVIHGKNIFLATEKGWLQNFDLCSGEIRWEQRYGRGEMHQFLYVQGDSIYTMDGKWHFVALDVQSGAIIWMSRLRSAGNWCPVPCGRFLVVLSREGHLAVLDPIREIKVWEDSIGMYCRQPPAIGMLGNESVLAVASNTQGLKLYRIHSNYAEPTGTI
ncbi:MAG: hypothetical protein EBU46_16430, partial [Nitrosomonadaceae bacterium]|nr:hypothetical protein [Nitrosomonadaceae bacterium]